MYPGSTRIKSNQTPEATMAFNTITLGSRIFNSIGTGTYNLSTSVFGNVMNAFRIVPGKKAGKTGPTSFSVTRLIEKDITIDGNTTPTRKKLSVSLQAVVPDGFTATDIDTATDDIASFLTAETVNRILLGES